MTTASPKHAFFQTRRYRLSHGKEPRGRGTWGFSYVGTTGQTPRREELVFSPGNMTLTEAKKWAYDNSPSWAVDCHVEP